MTDPIFTDVRPFLAGLLGGIVVLVLEVATIGIPSVGLAILGANLLLTAGLTVGAAAFASEALIARFELRALGAAVVRSLASLPLLLLATWRLFEGSYASTLLAPNIARVLCPIGGLALLASAFWLSQSSRFHRLGRWAFRAPLLVGLAIAHFTANAVLARGYPDILAASSLFTVAFATLLVGSFLPKRVLGKRHTARFVMWVAILPPIALVWSSQSILEDRATRWELATQTGHTAHLTALVRRPFDDDDDGYASILGGGDCDDDNAAIHPAAAELVGNGIDEDCDGNDLKHQGATLGEHAGLDERIDQWLATPTAQGFLRRTEDMDVVVFFIDTLRADLLANNVENRRDFPRIFELLANSRRFSRAFSPAAGTDVAMGTILTGKVNPFVRVRRTLFEAIGEQGYETVGIFPGEVLRWAGRTLISRGLHEVQEIATDLETPDHGSHSASLDTTRAGLAALQKRWTAKAQTFLWLHYFDVHEHLQLPSSALSSVWSSDTKSGSARTHNYRATLKLVDFAIGVFIDQLHAHGRWDDTIIVLASDHGESMMEDPRLPKAHGLYVYNPLVHVPLAIRIPEVAPRTISVPVALADVTPTLLALTGADGARDTEAHTMLHHLIDDDDHSLREISWPILLHEQKQWGIIVWPYKLMVRPEDNIMELYDLRSDFAEKRDLSFVDPEKVRALKELRHTYPPFRVVRTMDIIRQREDIAQPPLNSGQSL